MVIVVPAFQKIIFLERIKYYNVYEVPNIEPVRDMVDPST